MHLRKYWIAAIIVFGLSGPAGQACAWGPEGHMVVATVAEQILQKSYPKTWTQVQALLSADKDTMTSPDFASRAKWADAWRDSDRDESKKNYNATKEWHFVDIRIKGGSIESECTGKTPPGQLASQGPAKACVIDKIEEFWVELASPQIAQGERILALKYLLHFIGDIHQPLHAADNHDSGGNEIAVAPPEGGSVKLHGYWDSRLVGFPGENVRDIATRLTGKYRPKFELWADGGPRDWALESNALAVKYAYAYPVGTTRLKDGPTVELTPKYQNNAQIVVDEQLTKAGVRLAMVIAQAMP